MSYLSQNSEAREARKQKLLPFFHTSYIVGEGAVPPVPLARLLANEAFQNTDTVTTIPLGVDANGQVFTSELQKLRHVLAAGSTGTGKSIFLHSLIISLLYQALPEEVKLILIDPKFVEFSFYRGIPHLLIPPVTDTQEARGVLIWAAGEVERRRALMAKAGVGSIQAYNDAVCQDPQKGKPLPQLVIIVDELSELMMQGGIFMEFAIISLAQKAHTAGIHLVLCTQRPSHDVITDEIKAVMPSRIAFRVCSKESSHIILDAPGAEELRGRGDMLVSIDGAEPIRLQGAYASEKDTTPFIVHLKQAAGGAGCDETILAQIHAEIEKCKNDGKPSAQELADKSIFEDQRFIEACLVAIESGKASTSLLQRHCSLGYGRAAKYIDVMEYMGIITPPAGAKPREVLMTRDQFMELVAREEASGD